MFWSKKKKQEKAAKKAEKKSEKLREEALANVRAAKANIGDETLERIMAAMSARERSATEQAKKKIQAVDADRVLDELKWMMQDKGASKD